MAFIAYTSRPISEVLRAWALPRENLTMSSLPPVEGANFQKVAHHGISYHGVCYRNVWLGFANQKEILSADGSLIKGGRYNHFGAYRVLYLACDAQTCHAEMVGSNPQVDPNIFPRVIIALEVRLSNILDLTDGDILNELSINQSILTETDWKAAQQAGHEALTQIIGRLAKETCFEAIITPSAACPDGKNLCVFPDKTSPSSLQVVNFDQLPPE